MISVIGFLLAALSLYIQGNIDNENLKKYCAIIAVSLVVYYFIFRKGIGLITVTSLLIPIIYFLYDSNSYDASMLLFALLIYSGLLTAMSAYMIYVTTNYFFKEKPHGVFNENIPYVALLIIGVFVPLSYYMGWYNSIDTIIVITKLIVPVWIMGLPDETGDNQAVPIVIGVFGVIINVALYCLGFIGDSYAEYFLMAWPLICLPFVIIDIGISGRPRFTRQQRERMRENERRSTSTYSTSKTKSDRTNYTTPSNDGNRIGLGDSNYTIGQHYAKKGINEIYSNYGGNLDSRERDILTRYQDDPKRARNEIRYYRSNHGKNM